VGQRQRHVGRKRVFLAGVGGHRSWRVRRNGGRTRGLRELAVQRRTIDPRPDWADQVQARGLVYCYTGDRPYWDESAYYEFTAPEIDRLEAATRELQRLCLAAGQHIIDKNRFAELGIPVAAVEAIRRSWDAEPPAIYGRFDLAYDGHDIKLLEYNADTPTALLEASVIQWYWLEARFPDADQFNSLHERLVARWRDLKQALTEPLYFAHADQGSGEDLMTATYLRDTAIEAGLETEMLGMDQIGWNPEQRFVDLQQRAIRSIFKLYPWEWMVHEPFGARALEEYARVNWIEPIWKMLWSNKGLLAILWDLFPDHPNLLSAHLGEAAGLTEYARKPLLSREGANVSVVTSTSTIDTSGDYGEEGFVYQAIAPIPRLDGNSPVLGSWLIDGEPAGIGIRESTDLITDNKSRFVPHLFLPT
jgi:glutathionylspermidine synthase